jgi:triacylglycerol lipase
VKGKKMGKPKKRDPAKILPEITWDSIAPPFPDYPYFEGAHIYPFRHRATAFNMVNAWWLIEASTLAYAEEDFASPLFQKAGFTDVKFFTGDSTQCFVVSNDHFTMVVFRGTEIRRRQDDSIFNMRNIIADAKADLDFILTDWRNDTKVYRGFKNALDEVWEKKGLREYIRSRDTQERTIWFTGHSLGAALATLAADRYDGKIRGLYTFGSPCVGNANFAENFHIRAYRFVNNRDIITHWPPLDSYQHVGKLKHIDEDGIISDSAGGRVRTADSTRSEMSGIEKATRPARRGVGYLIPESIVDHVPTLYATHIWNNIP